MCSYTVYSHQIAQKDYAEKQTYKGAPLKIGHDHELARYIEDKIANEHYSPAAVLGEIKALGLQFKTSVCHTTVYSYIEKDIFLHVTNKDLPVGRQEKKYQKVKPRISYKQPMEKSIEDRPEDVADRETFGHWEMDTFIGKAKGKSTCLLVLTERFTRFELIYRLKQKTTQEVIRAINRMQWRFSGLFKAIFKSITTDNGTEFADVRGIEKGGRTVVFKCHPYSSWERGSNENANKLIRRFIPKGTDITKCTKEEIQRIEHWMNNYPRKIFGYSTSKQRFEEELQKLVA